MLILLTILAASAFCANAGTPQSITTSNLKEVYAPGDLVWEDTFDTFDLLKWDYEANMAGGGVSYPGNKITNNILTNPFFFRTTSSKSTPGTRQIPT